MRELWRCPVCGYYHEGAFPPGFRCPVCQTPSDDFIALTPRSEDASPFEGTPTWLNLQSALKITSALFQSARMLALESTISHPLRQIYTHLAHELSAQAQMWAHTLNLPVNQEKPSPDILTQFAQAEAHFANFADVALTDGFPELAKRFGYVSRSAQFAQYRIHHVTATGEKFILRSPFDQVKAICTNCGFPLIEETIPRVCPICRKPRSFVVI